MKKLRAQGWFVWAAILLASVATGPAKSLTPSANTNRHVIIISLDGFAGFYLNDPKADIPTLRQLMQEGSVATQMEASLPTMTWPNHTTLVTGVTPAKHGVLGNGYWDRAQGKNIPLLPDPLFDKAEIVKAPTVYDIAHEAGLKTAGVIWPASRNAKTLDWTVSDVGTDELFQKYASPGFFAELLAAGIPAHKQGEWCKSGDGIKRDMLYTDIVNHTLEKHRPNLTLAHIIELDHVEHAKGPRSPEAYEAVNFVDGRVKAILETAQAQFPGQFTLLITADHGFIAYRQMIQPNVKLRQAGLLTLAGNKIEKRTVFALAQGGSAFIYILDPKQQAALTKQTATLFKDVPGIHEIILPAAYAKHGLASPKKDARMPDLVLTAQPGFNFSENALGDIIVTPLAEKQAGAHGHSPRHPDMQAFLLAWGDGIKPGVKMKPITNRDVAPTAAALLGLEMPDVDGRVLKEILAKPGK